MKGHPPDMDEVGFADVVEVEVEVEVMELVRLTTASLLIVPQPWRGKWRQTLTIHLNCPDSHQSPQLAAFLCAFLTQRFTPYCVQTQTKMLPGICRGEKMTWRSITPQEMKKFIGMLGSLHGCPQPPKDVRLLEVHRHFQNDIRRNSNVQGQISEHQEFAHQ